MYAWKRVAGLSRRLYRSILMQFDERIDTIY